MSEASWQAERELFVQMLNDDCEADIGKEWRRFEEEGVGREIKNPCLLCGFSLDGHKYVFMETVNPPLRGRDYGPAHLSCSHTLRGAQLQHAAHLVRTAEVRLIHGSCNTPAYRVGKNVYGAGTSVFFPDDAWRDLLLELEVREKDVGDETYERRLELAERDKARLEVREAMLRDALERIWQMTDDEAVLQVVNYALGDDG